MIDKRPPTLGQAHSLVCQSPVLVVQQAGSLCLQNELGVARVLLVSSLRTGKWGIPKGHIEPEEPTWAATEREAFEEAGVLGVARKGSIGGYFYRKFSEAGQFYVHVHIVDVKDFAAIYPEVTLRKVKWFPLDAAARTVSCRGLRRLLLDIPGRVGALPH